MSEEDRPVLAKVSRDGVVVRKAELSYVSDGWRVRERTLPHHLIWMILVGRCISNLASGPIELREGDLIWVPPDQRHAFSLGRGCHRLRLLNVHVSLSGPSPFDRPVLILRARRLRVVMRELVDEFRLRLPYRQHRLHALVELLLIGVQREQSATSLRGRRLDDDACHELMRFVDVRLPHRLSPRELAATLRMPLDRFTRRFRASFGCAPRLWLAQERLRRAARLLEDGDDPISAVAEAGGYPDIFSFSKAFSRHFGRSPSSWRAGR